MAATRRLNELTKVDLAKLELPSGPVTIALSGGADSAALTYLCVEAGAKVDALHIDHGFPASPRLAEAAAEVAARLAVSLETVGVQVAEGPSPEGQAREARYDVFDRMEKPVLTAHTQDDNAETMLINLVRGTGAAGLTGIPYHRPPVVFRPILAVSRSDTREIATLAGLDFYDDPMNRDPSLTRNRVRQRVLPALREINPQAVESLARAAATLERDTSYLDSLVPDLGESDGVAVSIVQTLPRPLADRLLQRLLASAGIGVTAGRLERMWSVAGGESESQDLAGGHRVTRRGASIVVE